MVVIRHHLDKEQAKNSSIYFTVLAVFNLMMDIIHKGFGFFDVIFVIFAGLPLLVNKNWMYRPFGGLVSLICLYLFFAVLVSHIRAVREDHLKLLWVYGMGYVVSLLSMGMGLVMAAVIKINIKNKRI